MFNGVVSYSWNMDVVELFSTTTLFNPNRCATNGHVQGGSLFVGEVSEGDEIEWP